MGNNKKHDWEDLRIGERRKVPGTVALQMPEGEKEWNITGHDVSPTALAIIVPTEHSIIKQIPTLLQTGQKIISDHDLFTNKPCVLHRIFRHRSNQLKWVLSFIRPLEQANV
ncbi:MAG: hypothetical protein ABEJ65_00840 [bacterium]